MRRAHFYGGSTYEQVFSYVGRSFDTANSYNRDLRYPIGFVN